MDASIRGDEIISVSGFAFGLDNAKKANRDWKRLFGEKTCHMTDLNSRRREFSDITPEEGGEYLKEAVKIINRYSSYGVSASFDISKISDRLPKQSSKDSASKELLKGFRTPYAACCHFAMYLLGSMSTKQSEISYVFELGDEGQAGVRNYVDFVLSEPSILKERYGANSFVFVEKIRSSL